MADRLATGKLPPGLLSELLGRGPALPPEVRLGPAPGEDACAIDVSEGTLVAATDPITLTGSGVGEKAVLINANDVAVMGVVPRWFLATLLLPPGSRAQDARALFDELHGALASLGAALVGGHTEVTDAVTQPVVVGQMLGLAPRGAVVTTGGARPGHTLVQVGPAPVEGAAVLAAEAGPLLAGLPEDTRARARRADREPGISVVAPALLCARLGATALHDPTEGGLSSGLYELAEASGVGLRLEEQQVLWFEPGRAACRALGADPWGALASGALLAAFEPGRVETALAELGAAGWTARAIARVEPGRGVSLRDGSPLPRFQRDEVARVLSEGAAAREPR